MTVKRELMHPITMDSFFCGLFLALPFTIPVMTSSVPYAWLC